MKFGISNCHPPGSPANLGFPHSRRRAGAIRRCRLGTQTPDGAAALHPARAGPKRPCGYAQTRPPDGLGIRAMERHAEFAGGKNPRGARHGRVEGHLRACGHRTLRARFRDEREVLENGGRGRPGPRRHDERLPGDFERLAQRCAPAGDARRQVARDGAAAFVSQSRVEFEKFPDDPRYKLDILLESTTPGHLCAELDLAWVYVGGVDRPRTSANARGVAR